MNDQILGAFISALLGEGVSPGQINRANNKARDAKVGDSISALASHSYDPALVRAFVNEQSALLARILT